MKHLLTNYVDPHKNLILLEKTLEDVEFSLLICKIQEFSATKKWDVFNGTSCIF